MSKSFYFIAAARFVLFFAVQMQSVLMGWQMYELTHDPLKLGLIGLCEAIPALGLALFAGLATDRMNPKKLYQLVLFSSIVSVLIARFATGPEYLYLAAFVTGFGRSFAGPTMQAMIPRIVPREKLTEANAWGISAVKGGVIAGPAFSGFLLAWKGLAFTYTLAAVMLAIGFVFLFFVEYKHVPPSKPPVRAPVLEELLSGLRFVFSHRLLLSALALDMFAVFFGGVSAILPVYAADILHVGPQGLGILRASMSVGGLVMMVYLIRKPVKANAGRILLRVVYGFGVCILVCAFSKLMWLSALALMTAGALDAVSMVIRAAIVQLSSPDEMRGRIAAVNSMFIGSSNELGAFEEGVAAKVMGTVPSVAFGGIMTLIVVFIVSRKAPELRTLDLSRL